MMRANLRLERSYVPPTIFPKISPTIVPKKIVQPPLPEEHLPTMYDLPSEDPEEPGLPDDFHSHQPQLLRETFRPENYSSEEFYVAEDLNLYYDKHHSDWYKRPDWFAVLGVPPLYGAERVMRYSYVMWQEKVPPFIVVELLSDSSEKEDLGKTVPKPKKPPTKWEVYERRVKIPFYVIFSRDLDQFQVFQLVKGRYQEIPVAKKWFWLPKIQLGLGLWEGFYNGVEHEWLRWYDAKGEWIPTQTEIADFQAKRADLAETELAQLKALLAEKGLSL